MTTEMSTQDRETIIAWTLRRSGHAAVVVGAHPDVNLDDDSVEIGELRIGFPGYASEEKLEPISWDEFFETFNEHDATFYYEDTLPNGKISHVYRIEHH